MAEEKKYYIRVRSTLVQVTAEVYKACHQTKRKAKTLYEKDERNGLVSYDITPELEHRKSGYVERKRRPYQGNVVRIA